MFRRIVFSACVAGFVAGLIFTAVEMVQVVPIILEAETYETGPVGPSSTPSVPKGAATTAGAARSTGSQGAQSAAHDHGGHSHASGWAPDDGWERTAWTAIANIGTAIGFALVLVAIYSLRDKVSWQQGLLWGLGGYVTFFLSPAAGLTPEIPGANAAALDERQAWWLATVCLTALGLSLLALAPNWRFKLVGALLLAVPHLIGAPQPDVHGGNAPQELARAFVFATALANAVFWIVLGTSSALVFRKPAT